MSTSRDAAKLFFTLEEDRARPHATAAMVDMLQPWNHKAFLVFHQMSKEHGSQYAIGWFDCYAAVVRAT